MQYAEQGWLVMSDLIYCKDCKKRGRLNYCPFTRLIIVGEQRNRGTDTSPIPYNYGTSAKVICSAKDNDYCSYAERRQDDGH